MKALVKELSASLSSIKKHHRSCQSKQLPFWSSKEWSETKTLFDTKIGKVHTLNDMTYRLRTLHYAYASAKGRRPHEIERSAKKPINLTDVATLINKYIPELCVYIVTERNIGKQNHIPQSCHAALLFFENRGPLTDLWANEHKTVVVLGVDDIQKVKERLHEKRMHFRDWREPDLSNRLTSIVIGPVAKKEGQEFFKEYELL